MIVPILSSFELGEAATVRVSCLDAPYGAAIKPPPGKYWVATQRAILDTTSRRFFGSTEPITPSIWSLA